MNCNYNTLDTLITIIERFNNRYVLFSEIGTLIILSVLIFLIPIALILILKEYYTTAKRHNADCKMIEFDTCFTFYKGSFLEKATLQKLKELDMLAQKRQVLKYRIAYPDKFKEILTKNHIFRKYVQELLK